VFNKNYEAGPRKIKKKKISLESREDIKKLRKKIRKMPKTVYPYI